MLRWIVVMDLFFDTDVGRHVGVLMGRSIGSDSAAQSATLTIALSRERERRRMLMTPLQQITGACS